MLTPKTTLLLLLSVLLLLLLLHLPRTSLGVANGPLKCSSARKIWPLLDLLAKIKIFVTACMLKIS